MEEIVAAHPAVAECAVIGMENELRGQVPLGFIVLKTGINTEEVLLEAELVGMVRERLGALACFKQAIVVKRLPKTRSGKILRRIMRHIVDRKPYQAPSTIEDWSVLEEIENVCRERFAVNL
jgi:propionyl-CoA synthetase